MKIFKCLLFGMCGLASTAMVTTVIKDMCNSQLLHNYVILLCMNYQVQRIYKIKSA